MKEQSNQPPVRPETPVAGAGHGATGGVGGVHGGRANRLAKTQSPYLLQHASNPVDWFPWGSEAIEEARRRQVPLFVSIGYSTCYWCHVMERESFESEAVAAVLHESCVAVKVDREERPDVDELMMTACQVFTQLTQGRASGGWPLNLFLDPETLEPFFLGTYFPPEPGFGRPSFIELVRAVASAWASDRDGMREQARRIANMVRKQMAFQEVPESAAQVLQTEEVPQSSAASIQAVVREVGSARFVGKVQEALLRLADPVNGGFGGAPKFPTPPYPRFLLETGGSSTAQTVRRMLDQMAIGGIFDQVGGGFHRYAVDATWTVPHFEKMLYDNGQLASLYADAYRKWRDPLHGEIARRICQYVIREMTGEEGRFLSAQDAEVDAREGKNYLWTSDEVRDALERSGLASDVSFALQLYGFNGSANFQDPHHPDEPASYVLRLAARPDEIARSLGLGDHEFAERRIRVDAALLSMRQLRKQPMTDDKTIASWSGLMAEGLADAGAALGEPAFVEAAERGARFVLQSMRTSHGNLLRAWRLGSAGTEAFLEDYANMANACLAIARASGDCEWNVWARTLVSRAEELFLDRETGVWFDTVANAQDLFTRVRNTDDGAVPSGTGSILRASISLAELDRAELDRAGGQLQRSMRAIAMIAPMLGEQPVSATGTVLAAFRAASLTDLQPLT